MSKNIIKIREGQLKNIISRSIQQIISEGYVLSDEDELMEYFWLRPNLTGLRVDVFVDDCGSYERYGHELLLFVRNGYDKSVSDFISFSVSDNPVILNPWIDYNITYDDIFAVQDFILANISILKMLATGLISQKEFASEIRVPSYAVITENKSLILEMATLRMKDSELPMDIWLDEGATYKKHAPRIKFRASNEQRTTFEFSSMLLTNPPEIENFPDNSPLKKKDIDKLKEFVVNNLDLLIKLANGEISYVEDFLPNMKKCNG